MCIIPYIYFFVRQHIVRTLFIIDEDDFKSLEETGPRIFDTACEKIYNYDPTLCTSLWYLRKKYKI